MSRRAEWDSETDTELYHTHCFQVLAHQRHLEQIWHSKKVKLHQRLGLRLFQQDVKQVCVTLWQAQWFL